MLDSKEASLEPLVTMNLKPAMAISTYLSIITLNVNRVNGNKQKTLSNRMDEKARPKCKNGTL